MYYLGNTLVENYRVTDYPVYRRCNHLACHCRESFHIGHIVDILRTGAVRYRLCCLVFAERI